MQNLRLRLTGVDEDDVSAGFVVCSRNAVVPAVTYFNAQLQVRGCGAYPAQFFAHHGHNYVLMAAAQIMAAAQS